MTGDWGILGGRIFEARGRLSRGRVLDTLSYQDFFAIIDGTGVSCASCDRSFDALTSAKEEWCEVQMTLACQTTAWCDDNGECFCPEESTEIDNSDSTDPSLPQEVEEPAPTIFGAVVVNFLKSNNSHGVPLTSSQISCVAQIMSDLPQMKANQTRETVQSHILSELYVKMVRDDDFDNVQDAITGDPFNYNVAFVLENIKATEIALRSQTGSIDDINNWDFSSFDWSIDGKGMSTDLSETYQEQILNGLVGNPVKTIVRQEYAQILAASIGNLGRDQNKA